MGFIKKRATVEVELPMSQSEANETKAFIEFVASHLTFQDWKKLAGVLKKPGVKTIALNYIKNL